jgi:hypothetical protein
MVINLKGLQNSAIVESFTTHVSSLHYSTVDLNNAGP